MTKHVTLFGRKMRKNAERQYYLGPVTLFPGVGDSYWGEADVEGCELMHTNNHRTPQSAARALERKIVAAHRRLGKLMAGGGK